MAIISILKGRTAAHQLINGVFGRYDGEQIHLDPLLQRIYLMSLQMSIPVEAEGVVGFVVPDQQKNAFKANLLTVLREHWYSLYESRAPLSGILQGMLRAERDQVARHCDAIIAELKVGSPVNTAIIVQAHVTNPAAISSDDDESEQRIVSVRATDMLRAVEEAAMDTTATSTPDEGVQAPMGLDCIDMSADRPYDVSIKIGLSLYGDEDARALFVSQALPVLLNHGLCRAADAQVASYQEAPRDTEITRPEGG